MSLDVYLEDPTAKYETESLYWANITHNLGEMADKAGIYKALWRPEEIGVKYAKNSKEMKEKIEELVNKTVLSKERKEELINSLLVLFDVSGSFQIENTKKLLEKYRDEEMPDWDTPYHYDAEGWSAMKHFVKWLERKSNDR